jgi:hypothetical protein
MPWQLMASVEFEAQECTIQHVMQTPAKLEV